MDDKKVLKKNPDMVTRAIADETILVPIYKSSNDTNAIYTLNDVGSRIWALIDGKHTLSEIKKKLLKEFDANPKDLDKELMVFLKDLKDIAAIF